MKTTYKQMESLLEKRECFEGNSVEAVKEDGLYVIKSFGTVVAYFDEKWVVNEYKYSATTSKITNLIKRIAKDFELRSIEFFNEKFNQEWNGKIER